MQWSPTNPIVRPIRRRSRRRRPLLFDVVWFLCLAMSWGLVIAAGYGLTGIAVYVLDR